MSFKTNRFAALGKILGAIALSVASFSLPAFAGDIMVMHPYARASSAKSTSGAAFMVIANHTDTDDHLLSASSDIADKVELHTHIEADNGVMQMRHVPDGFPLPAGGMIEMKRGGHHVMFLGLNQPLKQDEMITLKLVFEKAGEITTQVPVDLNRKPMKGGMDHSKMDHGNMTHNSTAASD